MESYRVSLHHFFVFFSLGFFNIVHATVEPTDSLAYFHAIFPFQEESNRIFW